MNVFTLLNVNAGSVVGVSVWKANVLITVIGMGIAEMEILNANVTGLASSRTSNSRRVRIHPKPRTASLQMPRISRVTPRTASRMRVIQRMKTSRKDRRKRLSAASRRCRPHGQRRTHRPWSNGCVVFLTTRAGS